MTVAKGLALMITILASLTVVGCNSSDTKKGLLDEATEGASQISPNNNNESPSLPLLTTPTRSNSLATPLPITIRDSRGLDIQLHEFPERIIAYDSAVVEILFAIGEGQRIIGTHDFVTHPPETEDIPKLGSAFSINIEQIVALKPDLVFFFSEGFVDDVEKTGITVLYRKSLGSNFREVANDIRLWGRITGAIERAEQVAAEFENRVELIQSTIDNVNIGQKIFHDTGDLWTPGANTLVGEVLTFLKLQNIAHDIDGYQQLSPEVIVDRNPEIIITPNRDRFVDQDAFANVNAIKNNRVYTLTSDGLSVASPRFIEAVEELARLAYPETFR